MNRRNFLKTLAAIGVGLSVPVDALSHIPDEVIDRVWAESLSAPRVFYVNSWGALSDQPGLEGLDFCQDRRELFRLGATPSSGQALVEYIKSAPSLEMVASKAHQDFTDDYWRDHDGKDCPWNDWQTWAISGQCSELATSLDKFLDGLPDDGDYRDADLTGLSCRGDALFFFGQEADTAKLLGIDVSDLERCWSIDRTAVLMLECSEANALARSNNLPIRFEQWEG